MTATATAPKLTIATVQAMVRDAKLRTAGHKLMAARANAKATRSQVDGYVLPIFHAMNKASPFELAVEFRGKDRRGKATIDKPSDMYLCDQSDPRVLEFDAAVRAAHRAHGYTGPDECCPALIAERDKVQAEWALLEAGCAHLGTDWKSLHGALREQAINLFLGILVVK